MSKDYKLFNATTMGNTLDAPPHAAMIVHADSVSDGFHTMDELYDHRMALNIALFHCIHSAKYWKVMKSKLHYDGTMFEGYFIVMMIIGIRQISYHYKLEHWDKFQIPEVEKTPPYDGHTSQDVIERLMNL